MIGDHFWMGVGPGNYGRHYPRYMSPNAPILARQPDNFLLETWATLGLPAAIALVVVLVVFFRRTLSFVPSPASLAAGDEPETPAEEQRPRWEFYEGGMIGLVIGFVFRAMPAPPSEITAEVLAAAVRAVDLVCRLRADRRHSLDRGDARPGLHGRRRGPALASAVCGRPLGAGRRPTAVVVGGIGAQRFAGAAGVVWLSTRGPRCAVGPGLGAGADVFDAAVSAADQRLQPRPGRPGNGTDVSR